MDCFQLLEIRKSKNQKFAGGILAFPPAILIISFNKYLVDLNLEQDTEIYYILPASYLARTYNMLVGLGEIKVEEFCGKNNTSLLGNKPGNKMMLLILKKPSEVTIPNKRIKLN